MAHISEYLSIQYCNGESYVVTTRYPIPSTLIISLYDGIVVKNVRFKDLGKIVIPENIADQLRFDEEFEHECNRMKVLATYDDVSLDMAPEEFENEVYISKQLDTLEGLRYFICRVQVFKKLHPKYTFKELIIYGRYLLASDGNFWTIDESLTDKPVVSKDMMRVPYVRLTSGMLIPEVDDYCHLCGEKFNIDDVKNGNLDKRENGQLCHKNCLDEHDERVNRSTFLRIIRNNYNPSWEKDAYDIQEEKYDYCEIPNQYGCDCKICKRRPWFIFYTEDGDITIGWRKHVISITFSNGFDKLDMAIFQSEDTTKYEGNGEKTIHAWSEGKAREYLRKVFDYLHRKD